MPAFCSVTATSVRMPDPPPLTERQIAWARQHDWFYAINPKGELIVLDCYTKDGVYSEDTIVWTAGFRALRDWAGY